MDNDLKELFPEFLEEAFDSIHKVLDAIQLLGQNPKDVQSFEEVLRGIHTIKGGCGMFGLKEAKDVAHALESELQEFRSQTDTISPEQLKDYKARVETLESLLRPEEQNSTPPPTKANPHNNNIAVSNVQIQAPKTVEQKANVPDVLRVPVHLVGDALNGIWEVFLIRNQMSYLFEQQKESFKYNIEFLQNWEMLDLSLKKNITELESVVMAMRMSSVKNLFTRMEKVIETYLSSHHSKKIVFKTEGKNTELDKKVIDMLGEPLIHLIRNAMDHGIEDLKIRKENGKPEVGTIVLSAETNTDRVVIKIQDDGHGIDSQQLLKKAKQKGLDISEFEKGNQNPIDIIFMPGFSTAEDVTDVSGRGVGMDAVRHSLQQLGGNVSIETEVGKGSVFSINLPLSLSVITATIFSVNGQSYGSNVNSILEICKSQFQEIHTSNGNCFYEFRGNFIKCFDLRKHISKESHFKENTTKDLTLLVVSYKQNLVAIIVDYVEQNMEVIVKPLPSTVGKINFVNGMSILPTGRAIFILTLEKLVEHINSKNPMGRELYAS